MNYVSVSIDQGIASVTIERAEARNALNSAVLDGLLKTLSKLKSSKTKVVLLSGAGEQAFCAGADIKEVLAFTSTQRAAFFKKIATTILQMRNLPFPIVAKVHGFALAGGLGLVAASDIVLAADDAQFGLPEIAIGLVPMIVSVPLERVVGLRALSELMLTGATIDATRAHQLGLVTRIVKKSELEAEALLVSRQIASRSPTAIRAAKGALRDVSEKKTPLLLTDFAKRIGKLSKGKDFDEGIRAFLEKRPPEWQS